MLEVNGTLIVLVLSFLIFVWALNLVYVKPVAKAIDARAAKIEQDLTASRNLREEAQGVLGEYELHLAEVRSNAQNIINDAVVEAQKQRSSELAKVQADGRARVDAVRITLAKEKTVLVSGLVDSEMQIVETMMQKLIGSGAVTTLDRDQVQKAIEGAC
jgi:F-type H+-transporting ATPase subunit b